MKYILFVPVAVLWGCIETHTESIPSEQTEEVQQSDTTETVIEEPLTVIVTGSLYGLKSRCGGGANIPENHNIQPARVPLSNADFYFRKGETNDSLSPYVPFKTTETGTFSVELEPGNYCLIRAEHLDKPRFNPAKYRTRYAVDARCYERWWLKGLKTVEIPDTSIQLETIVLEFPCEVEVPCLCLQNYGAMTRP